MHIVSNVEGNFNNRFFQHSYLETSITTILEHNLIENNTARQIFFETGNNRVFNRLGQIF